METVIVLIAIGVAVGTLGTLIGAGGGFILVPVLMFLYPDYSTETITAISITAVACNALSGSTAYMVAKRVDYKAGIIFALCTIPGSILGVYSTQFISRSLFDTVFGVLLCALGILLFFKGGQEILLQNKANQQKGLTHQKITDKSGHIYEYSYSMKKGGFFSVLVGYFSPLLGIGGGIIHVPFIAEWLKFPVHIATATSHFILAIMATVSVIVHYYNGVYDAPVIANTVISISVGIIVGAQIGAYLSKLIRGKIIIKSLAICLAIVGLRILLSRLI